MKDLTPPPALLDPIETASRDEITALQLKRLKWTLAHAYANVALYRTKFDKAGIHPDDLRLPEDIARFPFTTKEDLRSCYPFGMMAVPMERVARIHASSGTTGKPTVVGYTSADVENWAALVARSIRASGGRPGDRIHVAYGYGLFTGGLGAHYGAEAMGCTVIPVSGGMTQRQVQLITDFRPDIIMVTPSYLLAIADEFERQGVDTRATSLKCGIFGAEPWTNAMRRQIEDRFDMHAVDIYGLSEVMGPGVANEAVEEKDGLYIWEDHFLAEVIDPQGGGVLGDNARGELVLTSLTKEALPIIRYRTRDMTTLRAGAARTMRRMDKITGRSDDLIILRGVNVFPSQIEEHVLAIDALSPHYQIELGRKGPLDTMTVRVEAAPGVDGEAKRKQLAGRLVENIKQNIGISIEVEIRPEGAIERSAGKAVRIIDKRDSGKD